MAESLKQFVIYRSGAGQDDCDTVDRVGTFNDTGYLVYNLATENKVTEEEMKQRLMLSTIENPIRYKEEIYWTERE